MMILLTILLGVWNSILRDQQLDGVKKIRILGGGGEEVGGGGGVEEKTTDKEEDHVEEYKKAIDEWTPENV